MSYLEKLLECVEVEWKTFGEVAKIQRGASPRPIADLIFLILREPYMMDGLLLVILKISLILIFCIIIFHPILFKTTG